MVTVVELMNCSMCLTNQSMLLSEMVLNLEMEIEDRLITWSELPRLISFMFGLDAFLAVDEWKFTEWEDNIGSPYMEVLWNQ